MKKGIILGVFSLIGAMAFAQNKIDFSGLGVIEDANQTSLAAKALNSRGGKLVAPALTQTAEKVTAIVLFNEGYASDDIVAGGFDVDASGDGYAFVTIEVARLNELAALECVKHVSLGEKVPVAMDRAREASHVDEAHKGSGFEHAFTGKGVVTGLFDVGLDPNHINFGDGNGGSRVKRVYTIKGAVGAVKEYLTADDISMFSTENADDTHGTHVLGIMSGSYRGAARCSTTKEPNLPYYGVAPDADIVVTCGDNFSANILKGVDLCMSYAEETNQPIVVNLSFGHSGGPHDGSTASDKVMGELGKRGILVVAAGNEGDTKIALSQKFANAFSSSAVSSILDFASKSSTYYDENIQVWSSDENPFEFDLFLYDVRGKKEILKATVKPGTDKYVYIAGSSVNAGSDALGGAEFDSGYDAYSWIRAVSNVSTTNNRYCVNIDSHLTTKGDGRYMLGIRFKGDTKLKQTVNAYTTGNMEFTDAGLDGFKDGMSDGSISDMACAPNIFVIGSYNTRTIWQALSGGSHGYGDTYHRGDVSPFSSYGTLFDGTQLPHVCAPGAAIISSYNKYFVDKHKLNDDDLCAVSENYGRENHWAVSQGTSMACPFAAGTVALWLEADPTLTVDQVIDIAKKTAIVDDYVTADRMKAVQWGAGKIDAVAGLKEILGSSGINDAISEEQRLILTEGDGFVEAFVAGENSLSAVLHSVNGTLVSAAASNDNTVRMETAGLAKGVYVMAINGATATYTRKIVVR